MKIHKITFSLICLFLAQLSLAQTPLKYQNERDETHLLGQFQIADLKNDTTYNKWFEPGYEDYTPFEKQPIWAKELKDKQVKIFMGTWCGDSQNWLPKFIKLWDELGLEREQLELIALSDTDENYKQGPNGEEKGWNIHRVPTFIFLEDGKEYARIVEFPHTNLLTDVAQIALGYPSNPSYAGANYFFEVFRNHELSYIQKNINDIYREGYYKVGKYYELVTLAKVWEAAGKNEPALMLLNLNTYYFNTNWYAYYKLAQLQEKMEENKAALENYEKVIIYRPDHEASLEAIKKLKAMVPEKEAESDS